MGVRSLRFALGAAATVSLVLSSCASSERLNNNGDTIVFSEQQEPDALNPIISDMLATVDATSPILEGLVNVDDKLNYVPVLATTVPTVENGLVKIEGKQMVVTWPLRHGVLWHDGKPFTSADVAFTYHVIMAPDVRVVSQDGYNKIIKIETPDPYTFRATFKQVYATYPLLFGTILPEHLLAKDLADGKGDAINKDDFNRHPIGTGPFRFKEWVSGDHITMTRFNRYWRGKPKVKALEMRIVPDENAAFTLLKSGDLDIYQSAAIAQYNALRKLKHVALNPQPALMWELISFDLKKPILQDLRVRQAIAYAINKPQISQKIYQGLFPVAYSDQSPLSWAYNKKLESMYQYDPDKARQLLDAAGWKPGPDGIRVKDGKRLSIRISTTTGRKPRELTEQVLRYYLKQVGIDLTIDNYPGSILFGPPPSGVLKGAKYDLAMYAWSANPDPDVYTLWHSSQLPPDGQNTCFFQNKEMDAVLEAGQKVLQHSKRKAIYDREQEILLDNLPVFPLLYWANLNPYNKRVTGFRPNPSAAGNIWNCYDWGVKDAPVAKASGRSL